MCFTSLLSHSYWFIGSLLCSVMSCFNCPLSFWWVYVCSCQVLWHVYFKPVLDYILSHCLNKPLTQLNLANSGHVTYIIPSLSKTFDLQCHFINNVNSFYSLLGSLAFERQRIRNVLQNHISQTSSWIDFSLWYF